MTELRCDANEGLELITRSFWVDRDSTVAKAVWMGLDDQEGPRISTTAKDGADGDKDVSADAEAKVVDTVAYEGLKAGEEYELSATLVDKATGEPVADASGVPVEAKAEFAPALSTGSQDVEIAFDASLLGGRDLVAFESLRKDEAEVASHADLSDEGQTVHVAVEVGTQAADAADGDQVIEAGKAKVIDTVAYKGLVPGETYIAVGTLMDKGTGEPFLDKDGNEVRACDDKRVIDPALKESALLTGVFNRLARSCFYGVAVKEGDESPYRNGCIPAGAASAAVVEAAEQAALAFEQAMYKFETHRALAVCDDYLRAANKRWSDASKAANKLEGEPANAAMTQALVDAFTELRVATVLMHGIVPAGCELICEYFDVDPVAFFSWDNIFASTDEFVESLGEKPGEHRVKPLPPRFDFFSKHESQY